MNKEKRCKCVKSIEDRVCIMSFQCELEKNHKGSHQIYYPGVEDNDFGFHVTWKDGDKETLDLS